MHLDERTSTGILFDNHFFWVKVFILKRIFKSFQMTKNILLLTKNYPPQIGGMEKYSFDLYNRLVAEGNTVKLIAA